VERVVHPPVAAEEAVVGVQQQAPGLHAVHADRVAELLPIKSQKDEDGSI
jgi:hypothetical protein